MRTLVIHPNDPTTDFLCDIYDDCGFEIIRDPMFPKVAINAEIERHDRVLLLGHGFPGGLLGGTGLLVDQSNADSLRSRQDLLMISCHANLFLRSNNLNGFATGMFISERREASMFDVVASEEQIDYSNRLFASAVRANLHLPAVQMREPVLNRYRGDENPIIMYNRSQMVPERVYTADLGLRA